MALGCAISVGCAGNGGCAPGAGAAPGAAATAGPGSAASVGAGMILSVSRRISFTFCTIDSHRLFCAATSMVDTAPVTAGPLVAVCPNCVDAVDCIFTLREADR